MKKILCFILVLTLALSFTAFAADFRLVSSSIANNAPSSPIDENVILLTFSEEVNPDEIASITVTDNGVQLEVSGYNADYYGEEYNIIKITINELEYNHEYVIDYSDLISFDGGNPVVNDPATITFTVEEEPEVKVAPPVFLSTLDTGAIIPDDAATEVIAETLTGWMIDVENGASFDKEITLVCALYDDNGLLKKIVTSSKTVLAGTTDQVAVGTYIPSETDVYVDDTEGNVDFNMAKIFVWDNMENKSPYVAAFSYDIVAPTPPTP